MPALTITADKDQKALVNVSGKISGQDTAPVILVESAQGNCTLKVLKDAELTADENPVIAFDSAGMLEIQDGTVVIKGVAREAGSRTKLAVWSRDENVDAIGACIGLITGSIIAYLKVPPFIATLGTQTIVYGINLIYTNAQPIGGFSQPFKDFFNWKVFAIGDFKGFSGYILFALFFGLLFWFIYNKTTHGKYMYAIGGNENAAEVSGVNVRKSLTTIYMIAGMMYAFAGFLMTGKSGGASASMGVSYELEAIAGCTIGGVSTTGGIGTVPGILVGVLVFELLKIIMQFIGVDPNYNYIVQGLVVITAVAMDIRKYVAKK